MSDEDDFFGQSILAERTNIIALEIARGLEEPAAIAARYGVGDEDFARLKKDRSFRDKVHHYMKELRASGVTFNLKVRLQAEMLLEKAYLMAANEETPANVRADLIKWHAQIAGFMPVKNSGGAENIGFAVQINFTGGGLLPEVRKDRIRYDLPD